MNEIIRTSRLDLAFWISALVVVGIGAILVIGERNLTRWLLLTTAVSNLMVFGLLRRARRRAPSDAVG